MTDQAATETAPPEPTPEQLAAARHEYAVAVAVALDRRNGRLTLAAVASALVTVLMLTAVTSGTGQWPHPAWNVTLALLALTVVISGLLRPRPLIRFFTLTGLLTVASLTAAATALLAR